MAAAPDAIDLGAAASITDPAGSFGPWIRRGDAHRSVAPKGWALLGHDVVRAAFRDADHLSADRVTVLERVAADRPESFRVIIDLLSGWMIFRDPPVHTRLRGPVGAEFTPRRVGALASLVEDIVERAFDAMLDDTVDGRADFTTHVARPVPALVIGALLGVPDAERHRLQAWSDDLASIVFATNPRATPPAGAVAAATAFTAFFGQMIEHAPGDGIIADLLAADTDLDRLELVGMSTMLLFAGHETTTSLLQQMAARFLESPRLYDEVRDADPMLVVHEFLRTLGPARTMARKARIEHERAGVTIRAGETVLLSIAAANHDERVFADPGRFDVARDPNPHLGFGWGLHHCLGAQLALLEATTMLRVFMRRIADPRPHGDVPPLVGAVMGYGRGRIGLLAESVARR